jgi:protein required for attachment to host cells
MNKYLIAVANGTHARFLTLESTNSNSYNSAPQLVEHEALLSAEHGLSGQQLWSSAKTGRNRGVAGQAHNYDDHREDHVLEFERRFAQLITQRLVDLFQAVQPQQLILAAEPQTLGVIRELIPSNLPKTLTIKQLPKDLCQLKPHELHDYLSDKELLPNRKRASLNE